MINFRKNKLAVLAGVTFLVTAVVVAAVNRKGATSVRSVFELNRPTQKLAINSSTTSPAKAAVSHGDELAGNKQVGIQPAPIPIKSFSGIPADASRSLSQPTAHDSYIEFADLPEPARSPQYASSGSSPIPQLARANVAQSQFAEARVPVPVEGSFAPAVGEQVSYAGSFSPAGNNQLAHSAELIPSSPDLANSYIAQASGASSVNEANWDTNEVAANPVVQASGFEQVEGVNKGANESLENGSGFRGLNPEEMSEASFAASANEFQPRVASRASIAPDPSTSKTAKTSAAKADKKKLPTPGGKSSKSGSKTKTPAVLSGLDEFKLAAQPELGAHYKDDRPYTTASGVLLPGDKGHFAPDPNYDGMAYDPYNYRKVYEGKTLNANQRPLLELGRPWYQLGQLSPGSSILGFHNNVVPQLIVFGDNRIAFASNNQNGNSSTQIATALNLEIDLKITATERIHAFVSPNSGGGQATRWLIDDNEFVSEADADFDVAFFEGDLGAIVGGFTKKTLPFDLPFAVGVMPLLFQNGVWMNDAVLGAAVTIPARNSPRLDITNMDITFFAAYDKIVSDAFPGDDSAARMYGVASFIEAMNGYFEIDYAFLDDRTFDNRSYHNIGIGFSRRYGRFLSNSTRVIVNAGQSSDVVENTADGVLLLSENSLITSAPSTIVPYMNFFAGFDRPQSAARAGAAGGVLNNTGILFESDNLTGYPTLDSSANDTFGMALGLNLLASDFSQQLVVEAAMLGVMGDDANRNAKGDQYGLGVRYQIPLTNSIIFRTDGMIGFLRGDEDVNGVRMELRKKF